MNPYEENFKEKSKDDGPDLILFENWVSKNYGGNTRTKTITREKHDKICKLIRGEDPECNAKFRFWVRNKGFQLITHNKETDEVVNDNVNGMLYISLHAKEEGVPMGERSIESFLRTNLPAISFYRKVAVVDGFYDIIKNAHIDHNDAHAGQKKTYRLVSDTYAFLPREVITFYLLHCETCKPRIQKYGPVPKAKKQSSFNAKTLPAVVQEQQQPTKQQPSPDKQQQQQQQHQQLRKKKSSNAVTHMPNNHIYRSLAHRITSQSDILCSSYHPHNEHPSVHVLDETLDLNSGQMDVFDSNNNSTKISEKKLSRKRLLNSGRANINLEELRWYNGRSPRKPEDFMIYDIHHQPVSFTKKVRRTDYDELIMRDKHNAYMIQHSLPQSHMQYRNAPFMHHDLIRDYDYDMRRQEHHLTPLYNPSRSFHHIQDDSTFRYTSPLLQSHRRLDSMGNDVRDSTSEDSLSPKDIEFFHHEFHHLPALLDTTKIERKTIIPQSCLNDRKRKHCIENSTDDRSVQFHDGQQYVSRRRGCKNISAEEKNVKTAAMDSSVAEIHHMVVQQVSSSLQNLSRQKSSENIKVPSQESISKFLNTYEEIDDETESTDSEEEEVEIVEISK